MQIKLYIKPLFAAFLLLAASICGLYLLQQGSSVDPKRLHIVATTSMIADAVNQLVEGEAKVTLLMGPGVDPHTYEPTLQDGSNLNRADLVFYNGLHLEGPMDESLNALKKKGCAYPVAEALDSSEVLHDPNFSSAQDPHIWFDLQLWSKVVAHISRVLQEKDPSRSDFYKKNEAVYLKKLDALDQWIQQSIAKVPLKKRILVTTHDAFAYFGRAYDVEVKSLQGISTVATPSLQARVDLKKFILEHQLHTIFLEHGVNPKSMRAIEQDCVQLGHFVDCVYIYGDALGAANGPAGSYIGMVTYNVQCLVKGFLE